MSIRSYTSLRRFSECMLTLLLFWGWLPGQAGAQVAPPTVLTSGSVALTTPTGIGGVLQTAVDKFGNWLAVDWVNGALYEYPVGGGAMITLDGPGTLGGIKGYQNPTIAFGANNDLYLSGNFNNCLLRFPWDPAKNTWDGLSSFTTSNQAPSTCGKAPYSFAQYGLSITGTYPGYFQPWGIAVDVHNNLVIAIQNGGNLIFSLNVVGTGINSTPGPGTVIINKLKQRANSLAVDPSGNIFFVEDSGGLKGAYMIPAGATNVASDADPSIVRIDPMLANVTGVATDPSGNIYVSDSSAGVYLVPNPSGVPNVAGAFQLTAQPATGQVGIDAMRGIVYIPNTNNGFSEVELNNVQFGAIAVGKSSSTPVSVLLSFFGTATPHSFAIEQAGATTPEFVAAAAGSCLQSDSTKADLVFNAGTTCTEAVTFSPTAVGNASAKLLMLDKAGAVLATANLQGTGIGSEVQVFPGGAESTIGSGLKAPGQVATDVNGGVYVADAGGAVQFYPKGSTSKTTGVAIGTGISAPSGVAVDGTGDVFIAENGSVVEVPMSLTGLNAAGQVTLKSGLGTNLKLALDSLNDLYITDPDNHRVVELSNMGEVNALHLGSLVETDLTGYQAPSGIAVDPNNNVFIVDGANLYEISAAGLQSTIVNTLNGPTGVAVDASSSVYVSEQGGTLRIPNENGTFNPADQMLLAPDNPSATSVALDASGNVYLANPAAGGVEMVSFDAAFNFGTLTSTSGTASQPFTVVNSGNAPLNITGFAPTADYSASATTCTSAPIAIGTNCSVTILFNPGPGDQGTLTGLVSVTGDEVNVPAGVLGTGVGAGLLGSTTTITVTNATVNGAATAIKVAATSGSQIPTGQVVLSISNSTLTTPITVTGTLVNGTLALNPTQVPAGAYTFTANYMGDRVFGKSSASATVTVAPGAVGLVQPTMAQVQQVLPTYPYILAAGSGANEPYDGSVTQYEYNYQVKVVAADGLPLIGQPVLAKDPKTGVLKQVATNYGSITLQGVPAGSGCIAIPVAADGTATLATDCLTINTTNSSVPNILTPYTITPAYTPVGTGASLGFTNPNYAAFTGTPISFTALRNPMVTISANPSSVAVSSGSSTKVSLTLTSILGYGIAGSGGLLNNYSLPLQLSCDGLPAYATCTFSYPVPDPTDPQSVDVGPAAGTVLSYRGAGAAACTKAQGCVGAGNVVMTITTNVPPTGTTASLRRAQGQTAFAAMFGVGLFGLAFGKRKSLRGRLLLLACLLICGSATVGISGCSTTQLGGSTGTPTPAGTYTVSVTARQVGSQVIAQTPGIVYGNQNQMSLPFTMNVTIQ